MGREKSLPLKTTAYFISFLFLYILLPMNLTKGKGDTSFTSLFLFYLVNILIIFFIFKTNSNRIYRLEYQMQKLQEQFNILNEQNHQESEKHLGLQTKIIRYNKLKEIIEELNQNLNLDSVANNLTSIAFSVISNSKGICILYFIDKQLNLQIFKTKKEDKNLVIKTKEGDIFDFWVLRHCSPLLIEDTSKDFRFDTSASCFGFAQHPSKHPEPVEGLSVNGEQSRTIDLEKLKKIDLRRISSLISSPIISEHRFFGTLRLDNLKSNFFSQDDLRFLVKICDLGASALENSELFQRARNLAIRDSLTSLYTKGYFLELLKQECKRSAHQRAVFSLLMLDIDLFKDYNDRFGHTAGDAILKKVSHIITESLKNLNPIVSRFGGEEFCVILKRTDKKNALSIADDLRKIIEKEKIILRKKETNITVSIGIATFTLDAANEDELIQKADSAMYEAKQKGRNQVCCI